jgi:hypothetical protein
VCRLEQNETFLLSLQQLNYTIVQANQTGKHQKFCLYLFPSYLNLNIALILTNEERARLLSLINFKNFSFIGK